MKEIIAIIRPGKDSETKKALQKIGRSACTSVRVKGRGKQRGLRYTTHTNIAESAIVVMRYLPKKMLYLVVNDRDAKLVIETLIRVNQTGEYGDGKIFVMDAEETYRIRTGEKGEVAIK